MHGCAGLGALPEFAGGAGHRSFPVVSVAHASPFRAAAGPLPGAPSRQLWRAPFAAVLPVSDDPVIARAQAGDAAAFRALYERHRVDVARLVYRMLAGRTADLDDVIQEVFVQVHRSLRDFRGQSKFTTWLHRVTVNVVLMHRRSARSRPVFADDSMPETRVDGALLPDEDADRRERMRAFARILDKLPEKKRDVFVLHELEGHAPGDIAKMVGAPVLTVRTRLFYARREIERLMRDEPCLAPLAATEAPQATLATEEES